jgi:hypothetical protein
MSEVGYKKPPKNRQFGQPDGNVPGITSAQRKMEIANAERATRIRGRMLEALEGYMLDYPEKEKIVGDIIKSDMLRLIREAEDRGLGTPVQSVNLESPQGTMSPQVPDDLIAALDAIANKIAGGSSQD